MLEQLKYQNHQNEVFEFGRDGIYVDTNDLHDYSWATTKKNGRIASLDHDVVNRKLPLVILCNTEEEGIAARNRLFEVVEKDVLAFEYGRIILGNYYFKCFVTKSVKKDYMRDKRCMTVTLTLTTDCPVWIGETSHLYMLASQTAKGEGGFDYPYEFPHDYEGNTESNSINNTNFMASNFRLIINGACTNPVVFIGDHAYQVNCDVGEGEYLTIDSAEKTIYITTRDGTRLNAFNERNKLSYIFEKIPVGESTVAWSGGFNFEIVLLDERSEPKWM